MQDERQAMLDLEARERQAEAAKASGEGSAPACSGVEPAPAPNPYVNVGAEAILSQRLTVTVTGFAPNDKSLFEDCVVKIGVGVNVLLTAKAAKQAMECEDGKVPYEWEDESVLSFPDTLKFSLTGRLDNVELFWEHQYRTKHRRH